MSRSLPLVIDDKKAISKAENHGVDVIYAEDFINQ
jgi:hypothetical protein